jgi:uncharacterized protein (DUF2336 family)
LLLDLEESLARSSGSKRVDALRRVTDLFLRDAEMLSDEQIDLFDVVIARLAAAIEARARAELAERLADAPNAPRGILRSLAQDEIGVARPVLTRSERLSDDDLVAVALAKGRDHMLAITERRVLTEPVTDVLVSRGDRVVVHAVAGNPGARLSEASVTALVERARADEALQSLLAERDDLPATHLDQLLGIARETARRRLTEALPEAAAPALAGALERGAAAVEAAVVSRGRDYRAGLAVVEALYEQRPLLERDLRDFAQANRLAECVCALARLVGLNLTSSERLFIGPEADLVLVVARSQNWGWPTVEALLKLREPDASPQRLRRAEISYEGLAPSTAQRVLHFIKVREGAQRRSAEEAASRRQIRSNVR